jgi:hypothetical protein
MTIGLHASPCRYSDVSLPLTQRAGCVTYFSAAVGRLASALRPRYHFVPGGNGFYERTPYRNHNTLQEKPRQVTRFIAVASQTNQTKAKSLYAFTISPMSFLSDDELCVQPSAVTDFPYTFRDMAGPGPRGAYGPPGGPGGGPFPGAMDGGMQPGGYFFSPQDRSRKRPFEDGGRRPPRDTRSEVRACLVA